MPTLEDLLPARLPTARRPLQGLSVLVVEDSRFACEAMRLLCVRSGARIRRADSLEHARRHLGIYRPSVLIVDVGLPDGSGLALIKAVSQATPRIEVVLGTSGDITNEADVKSAGADGFIAKPIANLAAFQSAILEHLPADRHPPGPRTITDEEISPDPIAFQDDLAHVAQVLDGEETSADIAYITQFLGGVARSVQDHDLDRAVRDLASQQIAGTGVKSGVAALSELVQMRIASGGPI